MSAEAVSADALDAAVTLLREALPDLRVVYVFGSATQTQPLRPDSDIDLAVLPARPLDAVARWDLQERLATLLRRDVDLVDLRSASTVMRIQVLRTGRVLYEVDVVTRQRFEMYALSAYALLNEERAAILADIHERGRVYGG
ncbi:MAG: nucleotidyltransferase domain-containing protein [Bacteroidetes bacterium]|jgi:predicted nucleotidyltransferase|nr:nucleotidyltransferase domain-containing protein [Bacteroidota bacterium]